MDRRNKFYPSRNYCSHISNSFGIYNLGRLHASLSQWCQKNEWKNQGIIDLFVLRVCGVILCNIELKNEGKSNRFTSNLICPVNTVCILYLFRYFVCINIWYWFIYFTQYFFHYKEEAGTCEVSPPGLWKNLIWEFFCLIVWMGWIVRRNR